MADGQSRTSQPGMPDHVARFMPHPPPPQQQPSPSVQRPAETPAGEPSLSGHGSGGHGLGGHGLGERDPGGDGLGGHGLGEPDPGDPALWRRRLRHDIQHELGTIIMLASAVAASDDVGPASRQRIEQLLGETRWLDNLLRRLDEDVDSPPAPSPELVRVDELTGDVVAGVRLTTGHRMGFTARPAWAHMEALALWRVLRNLLDNACRVAETRVEVQVTADRGWVVIQVDDDGPGFGSGGAGMAGLGLGIVHELVSDHGGSLEIRHGEHGGARIRVLLPSASPPVWELS